jgi:nitroreductase/dihydropteridine reductase
MNILAAALQRYSVKAYDPERIVPEQTMHQIYELLRCTPSSVNSQPWHFIASATQEGVQGGFSFNEPKVRNASHVVVLGAAALGVDATPMEGIDKAALDAEFGLAAQGLVSVAMVCFGYRSPDDANGRLPKSRLSQAQVFTFV